MSDGTTPEDPKRKSKKPISPTATAAPALAPPQLTSEVGDDIPVDAAFEAEHDDADADTDSAYDGSTSSETSSLQSSIARYRYENNRRYHAYRDGEYWVSQHCLGQPPNIANTGVAWNLSIIDPKVTSQPGAE
jgi:hypothetical protein